MDDDDDGVYDVRGFSVRGFIVVVCLACSWATLPYQDLLLAGFVTLWFGVTTIPYAFEQLQRPPHSVRHILYLVVYIVGVIIILGAAVVINAIS